MYELLPLLLSLHENSSNRPAIQYFEEYNQIKSAMLYMKQWHIYVYKDPSGYVSFMHMHVCKHRLAKTKVTITQDFV